MKPRRFPSLTVQILIGLLIGILIGWLEPGWGKTIKPMADIFLRMIKMIIAPLIFSTLVIGIAGTGDFKKVGRIGLKALIYFEIATTVALLIGLVTVNVFKPGQYIPQTVTQSSAPAQSASSLVQAHKTGSQFLTDIFPTSVVDAMARGDILQLVIFSIFFGLALAAIGEKGQPLVSVLNTVAETMFRFTDFVMKFAPLGVMAAIAFTVGDKGLGVLKGYASLVVCFYGALVFFVGVVLFLVCAIIRVPFLRLFRAIREPFTIAFTTASSEAALPTAMEMMERLRLPARHRRVCPAYGIQLQPGWCDSLPVIGFDLYRSGLRHPPRHKDPVGHDAYPDADIQGCGRRPARIPRNPGRHCGQFQPPHGRCGSPSGHRPDSRHGPHRH